MAQLQSAGTAFGAASPIAKAFGSNVQAGSLLVCFVTYGQSGVVGTCAGSLNGAFTLAKTISDGVNNQSSQMFYLPNSKAGAETITVTITGNPAAGIDIVEYSGQALVGPIDGTPTGQNVVATTVANNVSSTSVTTTTAGDLIVGGVTDDGGTATITAGSAPTVFTQRQNHSPLAGANMVEDAVQGAPGAISATWTFSVADRYIAIVAAFKPAPVGAFRPFTRPFPYLPSAARPRFGGGGL